MHYFHSTTQKKRLRLLFEFISNSISNAPNYTITRGFPPFSPIFAMCEGPYNSKKKYEKLKQTYYKPFNTIFTVWIGYLSQRLIDEFSLFQLINFFHFCEKWLWMKVRKRGTQGTPTLFGSYSKTYNEHKYGHKVGGGPVDLQQHPIHRTQALQTDIHLKVVFLWEYIVYWNWKVV